MKISDIKSTNDIFEYFNSNVKYGWYDKDFKCHVSNREDFSDKYVTMPISKIINEGYGCCFEQVLLMHELFEQIGIEGNMFCLRIFSEINHDLKNVFTHCFFIYKEGLGVCNMEYPDSERKGFYHYNSFEEALLKITRHYQRVVAIGEMFKQDCQSKKQKPVITKFECLPVGLGFDELNHYFDGLEQIKVNEGVKQCRKI